MERKVKQAMKSPNWNAWKRHGAALSLALMCATAIGQQCGVPGSDGPPTTVSGTQIVNTYYAGSSASVAAGSTSIGLGTNSGDNSTGFTAGDMALVIQMQGATWVTDNYAIAGSSTYGDGNSGSGITSTNGVGRYEFVRVSSVAGSTLSVIGATGGGLVNSYSNSGNNRYQVVRVPQYSSLTITGTLSPGRWNGNSGGVVAIDVAGTLTFSGGSINAAGKGFRGGLGVALGGSTATVRTDDCAATGVAAHGAKGEGISGQSRDLLNPVAVTADTGANNYTCNYPPSTATGQQGRGAPGNGGGGGNDANPSSNDQNSGGGGGGGFMSGGKGGNSWSSNLPFGGYGGTGVAQAVNLLAMGGGGGAGARNNSSGILSSGGAGGGIVIVRAGNIVVTGSGTVDVSGLAGQLYVPSNDGGGGGGGGGAALILASSAGSGALTINAIGGRGSNAYPESTGGLTERHGPGGGGGGGYVAYSGSTVAAVVNATGGTNGITTTLNDQYGAAVGSSGSTNSGASLTQVPGVGSGAACYPQITVSKQTVASQVVTATPNSTVRYRITATNASGKGDATSVTLTDPLPGATGNPFTGTPAWTYQSTASVSLAGGATRTTTTNPTAGTSTPAWSAFKLPGGASATIDFDVLVPTGTNPAIYQNPASTTYSDPTRTTTAGTVTPGGTYAGGGTVAGSNYIATSSTQEDVQVVSGSAMVVNKSFNPSSDRTPTYVSTLTITISNPTSTTLTGIAFTDTYPTVSSVQMANQTTGTTTNVCNGGTLTANANSLVLSGGSLAAGASCTITAAIQVGNNTAITGSRTYTNTVSVTATGSSGATASADFVMGPAANAPPVLTKTINGAATATVAVGTNATLALTLANGNNTAMQANPIVDTFPTGLVGAGSFITRNCNGVADTGTTTSNSTWTTTASSVTLRMNNTSTGSLTAGLNCNASLSVSAATPGIYINTFGPVTPTSPTGLDPSNTASATLRVVGPPTVTKTFTPSSIATGNASSMGITVMNPANNPDTLTAVAITDTYAGGLVNQGAGSVTCYNASGTVSGTATLTGGANGGTTVGFTGASLVPGGYCTIFQKVTATSTYTNTTGAPTATDGSLNLTGTAASSTLTVNTLSAPTVSKSFAASSINPSGTTTLTILISNSNNGSTGSMTLTSAFTDTLPYSSNTNQPMTVASASSLATTCSGAVTSSAVGATPAFVTLAAGSTIPPGGCTISVDVKVNSTVNSIYTNTIPVGALQTNGGSNASAASATLLVGGSPVVAKSFSPASIAINGTSTLTITLTSPSGAQINNVLLTDNLPTNVVVAGTPAITNTCGGTITTRSTTPQAVELSSGTVTAAGCSFSVNVTSATAGVYDNYIYSSNLTSSGGSPDTGVLATARLTVGGATISGRVFLDNGLGAGAANDGILTSGEAGTNPGVANILMQLTNCGTTVYSTVQTDGTGNYSFPAPSASGTVCVVAASDGTVTNTGASVNATALPSNTATTVSSVAYTYCRASTYTCASTQPVNSIKFAFVARTTYTLLNFGRVPDNTYISDGVQQAPAGSSLSYPQVYTANTAGTVTFTTSVVGTAPSITGWSEVLHYDANCDGSIAPTETTIVTSTTSFPVTAGGKVCLVLTEFTPPGAPDNSQRVVRVTSNFTYTNSNPALPATVLAVTDTTTVGSADGLTLRKEVCNSTVQIAAGSSCDPSTTGSTAGRGFALSNTGSPNDVLVYRIIYTNPGTKASTNLVINDATPPYTVHAAAATCPAALTPTALGTCTIVQPAAVGQSGSYRWTFSGTLNSNASGVVLMTVSIVPQ